ncbi:hypothetical protein TBLA_0A05730 [Henningerozyma blattae CBS 6284]|uniref:DNA-directed RNA polymerase I subunit RPA49 n=1 Tax=Henningerozyma blattae (strain ATCC 34711 / CBS 6284 / DSM 70876 / NBRC 10599 / NRRL Y-10934 / UCD 77-7) TaxID=1071380 RepID=I2GW64_HENB6|nr:hypothetical protein TBLA_0A05730 [Tetrapisispora blattae CBS 6284]CCH58366.1 hypothetical protein TBLA_0A05730 [Tetrapisispora blattae CBS 6284]
MSESKKRSFNEVEIEKVQDQPSVAIASFFKDFRAPTETTFNLYKNKKNNEYLLHGENERLEYDGTTDSNSIGSNQYLVGVFNSEKNKIELYKAPVIISKVSSKSKKHLAGPKIKSQSNERVSTLRNALGQAFGTKKAKKAISDLERNRIDADKLADSAVDIVGTVKAASKDLPTRAELEESGSAYRPTPLANLDATDVEQIYPIHNIIPKREWNFIRAGPILKEQDPEKKLELLPYTDSKYLAKKLSIFQEPSQLPKLQLLYYLSLLMGINANKRINNKTKLLEKLNSPPEVLVDGILDRFTISRSSLTGRKKDQSYFIDPQNEDKLLCYILVIILHLDNFLVEVSPLAQELNLKPSKLATLFRTIGAIVKGCTVTQAEVFGIPKSSAASYKVATLKVPFKLPELTKRSKGPRR